MGSGSLMNKVSASQPRDRGFEPLTGHEHNSSYDTSTGGSRKRTLESENFLQNRVKINKINKFKLI